MISRKDSSFLSRRRVSFKPSIFALFCYKVGLVSNQFQLVVFSWLVTIQGNISIGGNSQPFSMYVYKDKGNLHLCKGLFKWWWRTQVGEVTRGWSLHLSCKCDQIKNERFYGQAGYLTNMGSPTSL